MGRFLRRKQKSRQKLLNDVFSFALQQPQNGWLPTLRNAHFFNSSPRSITPHHYDQESELASDNQVRKRLCVNVYVPM